MERIVVLGAGYAGVLTAKKLEKKFKKIPIYLPELFIKFLTNGQNSVF